jgi:pimeloyl-ACP methyl ester carboxylesterase
MNSFADETLGENRLRQNVKIQDPTFIRDPTFIMIRRATGCTESHPPTLVIWGEKDNFVPRSHGETYAKLIPNCSELKIIPGAGHSAQVEKPEETAKSMMDFLAK